MKGWQMFQKHNGWLTLSLFVGAWVATFVHNWVAFAGFLITATMLFCTGVIISAIRGDR